MLRKRKNRRYNEQINDEEGDGGRKFNLRDKIRSERFEQIKDKHLQELPGEAITLKLIQRHGFEKPILVHEPLGLELRVPPKNFLVRDVRDCVGHQRIIDVMDVRTQKNIEMSMKDWCKYYESKNRNRLLNVISLEFSHTELDELVEAPMIVKLLDWVDLVWPKFLKESQTESTNSIDKMKYPKVQKYCLMSVKGSYTDFHIDFGGTSVWYHVIRGKKIFWMVPPTELNLQTFEEWTLSGMQQDVFFGDTVEECFRVELTPGNTFFIPSGWIHAVYTVEDSLVFGGNFLHSFGIENQLKVSKIEDATKVPVKFRYPFYTEILWYVVQHYVHSLTGKDHLHRPDTTTLTSTPEKHVNEKTVKQKSIRNDDEITESEQDESDTKKGKAAAKRKRGKQVKAAPKKSKKPSYDDDESTEIDSNNEEDIKPAEKKSANTCRMTKNSLLRLQYEIDEQSCQQLQSANKSSKSTKQQVISETNNLTGGKSVSKKQSIEPIKIEHSPQQQRSYSSISGGSSNLTEMVLSHDTAKLNGWSSNGIVGGQTTWSNPDSESKAPAKIYITKIELNGLKVLVKHLSKLSRAKKNLPTLIRNSRTLLDDCRKLIAEHENDDPELAITGKPITPELLNQKKSNINELIEQFFKPTESTTNNDQHSSLSHSLNATKSLKSDSATLTHQQRLKLTNNSQGNDEKKTSSTVTSFDGTSSKMSSTLKEAKCLSPNKKLSNIALSSTTSSSGTSTPPRPKSPPTRPLSNNQYTSKSKNDNNLLLPGSFADLIAATSTEKKAFDVSSSDVTSSLFGIKDPCSSKSSNSPSPVKTVFPTKDKEKSLNLTKSAMNANKQPNTALDNHPDASISTTETSKQTVPKPNSPEPPKPGPLKRFVNPAFRPQVKEKLIFASAPYVSPVHVSDQARPGNLYPWQGPGPQHQQQQQQPSKTSTHLQDNRTHNSYSIGSSNTSPGVIQQPYTPDSSRTNPQEKSNHPNEAMQNKNPYPDQYKAPQTAADRLKSAAATCPIDPAFTTTKEVLSTNEVDKSQSKQLLPNLHSEHLASRVIGQTNSSISNASERPPKQETELAVAGTSSSNNHVVDEGEQKIKKPMKPRGPPKKSKEARQALELSNLDQACPVVPVSVIKLGPGPKPAVIQDPPKLPSPPAPVRDKPEKPKARRPYKHKDDCSTTSSTNPTTTSQSFTPTSQPIRQPVICGLVAPPITSADGNAKINPQQYLISRPLLFNTMPTFSSAQLQQMTRASMPILSAPVPSSLGLPTMQQGARIVWATQPRRLPPPVTDAVVKQTTSYASPSFSTSMVGPPRLPTTSSITQPDNAALLSLATTALSTAPMPTSPALSHLSTRTPSTQAMMVGSAAGQPGLFAGQQFFSSLVQRMPMAQFAAARPGAPRPSGQLVFARLPNQGQPRFLITQPGFISQPPQAPLVAGQPGSTFAFAYKPPPGSESAKPMKSKKVKTS